KLFFDDGEQIFNVNYGAVEDCAANSRIAIDGSYRDLHTDGPMMRRQSEFVTLNEPNQCVIGPAHLSGTFGYRIQYRLDVRRRAGDDPKDCTSRRLLLQRFLEFLEQPHVLDGDHRLVGEGL